jgi:DNA-binding MarR family transcriptional regulator
METVKNEMDPLLLENQLCFPLYACSRRIVNLYTPYFQPLGITYTQYIVFLVLWENDGVSVRELGQRLYLDSGTLTPLLKKMEEAGFVKRTRSAEDGRVVLVHLTEKGRALRAEAAEIPLRVGGCLPLSEEEVQLLHGLLYRLLETENPEE